MRILVIPASKHGGTAEIGRAIARLLRQHGLDADVSQPEHMFDLSPYAAHIIGSGLYLGNWLPAATAFIDEHGEALRAKPTWLFSSGPLGDARPAEPVRPEVVEHLVATTGAREHRLFGGRLSLDRLSRTDRFIARWVGATDGDHREWDEIEDWTLSIIEQIQTGSDRTDSGQAVGSGATDG